MPIESIDIVMFNMSAYSDWQHGIANRNMYVLHHLLQDPRVRKVVAVDYLPFTFKRAVRQWFQGVALGLDGKVLSRGPWHKLTAVRAAEVERTGFKLPKLSASDVPYKLFAYSDVASLWDEAAVYRRLKRELERLNVRNLVLWSYLPTFVGYFGALGESLRVFDAVDNWVEHSAYVKLKERLKLNYQTVRSKADIIFTTSPDLTKLFDRPDGCSFVPNGVEVGEVIDAPRLVGRDIARLPRPIIGYIGTIQEDRVDVELVRELALMNPHKSFVLIGGVWPGLRQQIRALLKPLPNVYLLGRKSFRERSAYLREFSVGIIPHKQNEFNRHTNPMKLYEYLAAGKPVVATPTAGLEAFRDVVHSAATPKEFNRELLKALGETSPELVAKRQAIAAEQAWGKRVNVMLEAIFARLNPKPPG